MKGTILLLVFVVLVCILIEVEGTAWRGRPPSRPPRRRPWRRPRRRPWRRPRRGPWGTGKRDALEDDDENVAVANALKSLAERALENNFIEARNAELVERNLDNVEES